MNIEGCNEFIPPRPCPIFEPNEEEFKDPLLYIAKIKPIGEKFGICKIKPPPNWQPPFAVDIDKVRFTPRLQRLNELEATTRIKLNFLDQIARFWDLQGFKLRIPQVDRKALDLYSLYKAVKNEGGYNIVIRDRKWTKVAVCMGYSPYNKSVGGILRQHYEKILLPFDLFKSGESLDIIKNKEEIEDFEEYDKDKNYTPHAIPYRQSLKPEIKEGYTRRTKRNINMDNKSVDFTANNELKKLQFFGAGPKLPGVPNYHKDENEICCDDDTIAIQSGNMDEVQIIETFKASEIKKELNSLTNNNIFADISSTNKLPKSINNYSVKINKPALLNIESVMCQTCGNGDDEEFLLLCENCDLNFHTFCLMPPLKEVPKGDWRCPLCIANECKSLVAPFGFEQSCKEYTLHSFGEMADEFKATYFNMPFHMVPTTVVEKEFWRLVSSIVEDITVCYGADLHCIEHGSGFPTEGHKEKFPDDEEYINSPWNLNNLPVLNKSILKYISGDISGMKVPWMYVGMCFSTFCWHTEDHWSYSINYLHWGEPKTWYGVPGANAEMLENVMKAQVPELFETQKDLLHQLVTLMNPNILMANGVPVSRCDQYPGEFMVTFPRAYHAGFNQGYNLAEAVNFCPSDWLPLGRKCVSHYRELKRYCVFSHEELICKMASCPEHLDLSIASATLEDMTFMIEEERRLRKFLYEKGVTKAEREIYELLGDDERKCDYCNTTCFLSALTCNCLPAKIVCLYHTDNLCKLCTSADYCLKYRYTLDELPSMMSRLKAHVEYFQTWSVKVKKSLEGGKYEPTITTHDSDIEEIVEEDSKITLENLKGLYKESVYKKFPPNDLTNILLGEIDKAEKFADRCKEILKQNALKPKKNNPSHETGISVEELQKLVDDIKSLACTIKEETNMSELLLSALEFKAKINDALSDKIPDVRKLKDLIDSKLFNLIQISEKQRLKDSYDVGLWLIEVRDKLSEPEKVSIEDIGELMQRGSLKPQNPALEKCLKEMHEISQAAKAWEEKAHKLLATQPSLNLLENFMVEIGPVPIHLPNVFEIKELIAKAIIFVKEVRSIMRGEKITTISHLSSLLDVGKSYPLAFNEMVQYESLTNSTQTWRERAVKCFLKKNSTFTFEEVICPQIFNNGSTNTKSSDIKSRKRKGKSPNQQTPPNNNITNVASGERVFDIMESESSQQSLLSTQEIIKNLIGTYHTYQCKETDALQETRAKNSEKYQMFTVDDQITQKLGIDINNDNKDDVDKDEEENGNEKFCICNGLFKRPMLCCQLCREWFHYNCVLSPKFIQTLTTLALKNKPNDFSNIFSKRTLHYRSSFPSILIESQVDEDVNEIKDPNFDSTIGISNQSYPNLDSKYICLACIRSRRPKLETAFSLLLSLQRLPIKTLEGAALQCLTERAVKWQEKVQKFLANEELASFLLTCKEKRTATKLSSHHPRPANAPRSSFNSFLPPNSISPNASNSLQMTTRPQQKFSFVQPHQSQLQINPNTKPSSFRGIPINLQNFRGSNTGGTVININNSAYSGNLNINSNSNTSKISQPNATTTGTSGMNNSNAPSLATLSIKKFSNLVANKIENSFSTVNNVSIVPNSLTNTNVNQNHQSVSDTLNTEANLNLQTLKFTQTKVVPEAPKQPPAPLAKVFFGYNGLNRDSMTELENLMMEGDLIELTLHETQYLWEIYKEAKFGEPINDILSFFERNETKGEKDIGDVASVYTYLCNSNLSHQNKRKQKHNISAKFKSPIPSSNTNIKAKALSTKYKMIRTEENSSNSSHAKSTSLNDSIKEEALNDNDVDDHNDVAFPNTLMELGIQHNLGASNDKRGKKKKLLSNSSKRESSLPPLNGHQKNDQHFSKLQKLQKRKLSSATNGKSNLKTKLASLKKGPNFNNGNTANGKKMKIRIRRKPLKFLTHLGSERFKNGKTKRGRTEDGDENNKCSLPTCLEPVGSDITWVLCDGGCDEWFHMVCVGLSQKQLKDNDDYFCYKCKSGTNFEFNLEKEILTGNNNLMTEIQMI
ncbi:unnamed protein product [Gordionus sp. m RMFG-2023]|uniref:lysine-specific demethylase 5C-like n=1 Tax=Gordionus sp. m RMFG-2023 TaxID=3053472 RepID=UPI0030E32CE3